MRSLITFDQVTHAGIKMGKFSDLLKKQRWSPLAFFAYISSIATLIAVPIIRESHPDIDTNDPGVLTILAITAFFVYGAIWLFVKGNATQSRS